MSADILFASQESSESSSDLPLEPTENEIDPSNDLQEDPASLDSFGFHGQVLLKQSLEIGEHAMTSRNFTLTQIKPPSL